MQYPHALIWKEARRLGWRFAVAVWRESRITRAGVEIAPDRLLALIQSALAVRRLTWWDAVRSGRWGTAVARLAVWIGAAQFSYWLARRGIDCGCTRRQATLDRWGTIAIGHLRAALRRAPRR